MVSLVTLLTTALVLGVRHALDPDHLAAVSTLVAEERQSWPAARLGLIWGLGHMLPIALVGLPVLLFRLELPETMESVVDLGVGVLLVVLGVQALWRLVRTDLRFEVHEHDGHVHAHLHGSRPHDHPLPGRNRRGLVTFAIGMVHGLAGSGAAAVLSLAAAPNLISGVIYLLLFGLGTCLGMFATTLLVAAPAVVAASRYRWVHAGVRAVAGLASITVGVLLWVEIVPTLMA
ncbi:MAG: sulfite exporter TauE/SafE family protein [Symbiobacterium sp.]|uniref:HoxN/HupN/NixA family nickel/cobalt transporter n=1 Tax=Symbiobacterium sp. TaxID=1971213 RepID=UPI00346460CB